MWRENINLICNFTEPVYDDTCCHFPFKYKGKTYTKADGCTKADDFLPWCPTISGDVSWTHNDFAGREKDDRYCDETCMKGIDNSKFRNRIFLILFN